MKEKEAGRSFSWIHETLKSTATLQLIFGAALVETIVATPQNRAFSYSLSHKLSLPLYLLPSYRPLFLSRVFICSCGTVSCRAMVKIKSLVISPEILLPAFSRVHSYRPVLDLCIIHPSFPSIFLHCDAANAS